MSPRGSVAIVGAGPGDPGLLTRRAEELLRQADVVLCDRLVGAAIRELIPAHVRVVDVGKSRGQGTSQSDIQRMLLEEARAGRRVVRLKGGDPFVFGRGGEEALAVLDAGIGLEIVPGISSALAAPAAAGIPLTHRATASSFVVLTAEEKSGPRRDWRAATHADTVVLLMGVSRLGDAAGALIEHGKEPDTPAAVVAEATRPAQRVVHGTLSTIAQLAARAGVEAPAVLVAGPSVPLGLEIGERFAAGSGEPAARVLVTRAPHQAPALAEALRAHGAEPVLAPAIRIVPAPKRPVETALRRVARDGADWVVFTSANGVAAVFGIAESLGLDARAFAGTSIAAIGRATASALAARGITADLVSEEATTRGLARAIPPGSGAAVLFRADLADPALSAALRRRGYDVTDVTAYRIKPVRKWPAALLGRIRSGELRLATFASAETARAAAEILDAAGIEPSAMDAVCIGPVCARGARQAGFRVRGVASEPTAESLAEVAASAASRRVSGPRARRRA